MITLGSGTAADEGYLLCTAAKLLNELQAMGTACHLVPSQAPWQLAMEGTGDLEYIRRQVLDIFDGRRGNILIEEAV